MSKQIPSPCFVLDERRLEANLKLLQSVRERSGVDIMLALKAFAMWSTFPMIREYLSGAAASSLNEATLCAEQFKTKSHTYAAAYSGDEFDKILAYSSHITFNSLGQFECFGQRARTQGVSCGLRVNPGYSDVETALYNPSAPASRLGAGPEQLAEQLPEGIDGLHFHVLCESDSYALEKVLEAFESRFSSCLSKVKWVNMGGGHALTREGYDIEHMVNLLRAFKEKHQVEVILEPGSAIAWQAGELYTTVLDIVHNGGKRTAIMDASFTCHMPDCLEMPYRPKVSRAYEDAAAGRYRYRLGGVSCLAGDFLEEYAFDDELAVGDRLIFEDMMHYTMVKTTSFNGVKHPSIGILRKSGEFDLIKTFTYNDYRDRLS